MNTPRHVLQITPDGTITGLYTDAIPLAELGAMTVRRASTIEYCAIDEVWEVRLMERQHAAFAPLFRSPSRATCLAWEHEYFNQQLERQV